MRLRQIALVAHDLEASVDDLCGVLGLEIAFRDPGVAAFGLHNAVLPVGDTFLEVVSPVEENTTAGRLLARRGGDGGYMVILQTGDLTADRRRLAALGVRVVWETELPDIATVHLHPRDVGGAIVSLDAPDPPDSWRWAGPDWRSAVRPERCAAIAAVELEARDPRAMAARWSQVLDRPLSAGPRGDPEIRLGPRGAGTLRFLPAGERGEGFAGFEIAANDARAVLDSARARGLPLEGDAFEICGTRIRLR